MARLRAGFGDLRCWRWFWHGNPIRQSGSRHEDCGSTRWGINDVFILLREPAMKGQTWYWRCGGGCGATVIAVLVAGIAWAAQPQNNQTSQGPSHQQTPPPPPSRQVERQAPPPPPQFQRSSDSPAGSSETRRQAPSGRNDEGSAASRTTKRDGSPSPVRNDEVTRLRKNRRPAADGQRCHESIERLRQRRRGLQSRPTTANCRRTSAGVRRATVPGMRRT